MTGGTEIFEFDAADEAQTLRCAAWLAAQAEAGWLIFLSGDLGVGKTAFARGLIQARSGAQTIVPSPSFTLVQPYETSVPPILHSDFYRLEQAQDIDELGIGDALDSHICLIEWAERADELLPPPTVRVDLALCDNDDDARRISISGDGVLIKALKAAAAREAHLVDFLNAHDWGKAQRSALAGDASTRRYERLAHPSGQSGVLMDWIEGADGPPIYDGKSYSERAHLAEAMPAYCAMVDWLDAHAMAVPQIMARDEARGFVLMEDFGDCHIANDTRIDRLVFYREAVASLVHLHTHAAADFLAPYDGAVQSVEAGLFTEWFLPHCGIAPDAQAIVDWHARWQVLGDGLLDEAAVTVLRDFHSVNILWREDAQARFRIGLIDVQDALAGHAAYDLASLLYDARVDVSPAQQAESIESYCAARFGDDQAARDKFAASLAICAVQRNMKIAGIFVRLAIRDHKPAYLQHVPRVLGYIKAHIDHPALAPIAEWLALHAPTALEQDND